MLEFLNSFSSGVLPQILSGLYQVIMFALLIGILIAVHEFGHFLVAKICGVGVIKFSLGFGSVIIKKQYGETIYQLCWIPLGGYVRLVGDVPDPITGGSPTDQSLRGEEETKQEVEEYDDRIKSMIADHSRWFIKKGFWARTSIVVAGPLFNLLLAFFVYIFAAAVWGEASYKDLPVIGSVDQGSPAQLAGILPDDRVVALNNEPIETWSELATKIQASKGKRLDLDIIRNNTSMGIVVAARLAEIEDDLTRKSQSAFFIGIKRKELIDRKEIPLYMAPISAAIRTGYLTMQTYAALWKMVTGKISSKNLAGPIFIFKEAGQQASKGAEYFLHFLAILSISLAVINLLPIPILDGGHILFFVIEALLGPISVRKKEYAQQVGLMLILLLMVYVVYNDIENHSRRSNEIKWRNQSHSESAAK